MGRVEDIQIQIEGLAKFSRDLKKMDSELPKGLRVALNQAADVVVQKARPKVPSISGRARRSVKARSTRTKVRVVGGGNSAEYYPFLDFGGRVGPNLSVRRPFKREGRYIYKAYYEKLATNEFADVLERSLLDVARKAGVGVD